MNKRLILILVLCAGLLVTTPAWQVQQNREIQAVIVKVFNNVQRKAPTTGWQKAIALDRIRSGHQIRTDEDALAMVRFPDETKLIVRPKSIIEVKGQVEKRQIVDRSVHIDRGRIGFNVKKQQSESFRFSSPISVASIRGTDGEFSSSPSGTGDEQRKDMLIIINGLATLTNLVSNQSQDVGTNQTGESNSDGNLNVRPATNNEITSAGAPAALPPPPPPPGDQGGEQGTGQQPQPKIKREIRIEMQDPSGNKRDLVIEWEQ